MRGVWGWALAFLLAVGLCGGFASCASSHDASRHYAIRGKGIYKPAGCGCKKTKRKNLHTHLVPAQSRPGLELAAW